MTTRARQKTFRADSSVVRQPRRNDTAEQAPDTAAGHPAEPPATPCIDGLAHHWVLNTPNGAEHVPALCVNCGAERQYRAGWPGGGFQNNDLFLPSADAEEDNAA